MTPFYVDSGIPGWMSCVELQWLYATAAHMDTIVEVGSWAGRSTHALLTACKGQVTAVDNWDQEVMKGWGDAAVARKMFIEKLGKIPHLRILEMPSLEAAKLFEDLSVDMVFLDGTHVYEPFRDDIVAWLPKTKKIICGHDFNNGHPGVEKAVVQIFGGAYQFCESIWSVNLAGFRAIQESLCKTS